MGIYFAYMLSPIVIFLIVKAFRIKGTENEKNEKRIYLLLMALVMIFFIGFRNHNVGSMDTTIYYNNWKVFSTYDFSQLKGALDKGAFEPGYTISVWIFSHIFKHPQMLFVLSATFFAISVCRFVEKNCENAVLAFLVFNCLGLFSFFVQGLRQSIAMCICLFAIEKIKKKEYLKFALLVFFAMTFHGSAIVFIIVPILKQIKFTFFGVTLFSALAIAVIAVLPRLLNIMNVLLKDEYEFNGGANRGGVVAILIYLVIIIFGLLTKDEEDSNVSMYIYMAITGVAALIMRNSISEIAERINFYFAFAQMALVANGSHRLKEKGTATIVNILIAVFCLGVAMYKASYSVIIPYTFFWQ